MDYRLLLTCLSAMLNLSVIVLLIVVVNPYRSELAAMDQKVRNTNDQIQIVNAMMLFSNYSRL